MKWFGMKCQHGVWRRRDSESCIKVNHFHKNRQFLVRSENLC